MIIVVRVCQIVINRATVQLFSLHISHLQITEPGDNHKNEAPARINPELIPQADSAEQKLMPNVTSGSKISSMRNDYSGPSVPNSNKQGYRPVVQPAYQPPPNYRNQGTIMKNEAPARIIPIAALNPHQGRWAIKARVTAKGDLRHYNTSKGDVKVFSFDLLDSNGEKYV